MGLDPAQWPKSIFPVGNAPNLAHLLDHIETHGARRFTFTLFHGADVVEAFLGGDQRFRMVREDTPRGTAGAVIDALDRQDLPRTVVIHPADSNSAVDLSDVHRRHVESGKLMTVVVKHLRSADIKPYGTLEFDGAGNVTRMVEKSPRPNTRYASVGTYFCDRDLFALMSSGEIRFKDPEKPDFGRDVLPWLAQKGLLLAVPTSNRWTDIGTREMYIEANITPMENLSPNLRVPAREASPGDSIWLGDGVTNHGTIHGNCIIGDGAVIERGAHVGPCAVLGPETVVSPGATIRESVTFPGARIRPDTHVEDSVVVGRHSFRAYRSSGDVHTPP
jgi:NDP-sugar pyrophosphorylase family protein